MELNTLTTISPVDGRYRKQVQHLDEYFSEYALIKYRVQVEIEYLLFLEKNHDVKAVEYFLKNELEKNGGAAAKEWVHFGLTSQDINNTAIPLSWKHAIEYEYLPALLNLNTELKILATEWKDIPMLAHTHGQPASPTKLGKEIMVFVERIENQIEQFIGIPFSGKVWRCHREFQCASYCISKN